MRDLWPAAVCATALWPAGEACRDSFRQDLDPAHACPGSCSGYDSRHSEEVSHNRRAYVGGFHHGPSQPSRAR